MITRAITIYNRFHHVITYGVIGLMGAALDLIVFALLVHSTSINPAIASFISVSCGIINNFLLNAFFNFKKRDNLLYRFVTFYGVGLIGAILSSLMIWLLIYYLRMSPISAKLLTIFPVVLAQYLINKNVSFRDGILKINYSYALRLLYYGLPFLLICLFLLHSFRDSALGYDDSYNLQVSANLAHTGLYATNGSLYDGNLKLFDPNISTGPTLLVPIALCIKLFGNTILASRIVPLLILLLFLVVAYRFIRKALQEIYPNNNLLVFSSFLLFCGMFITLGSTENLLFSAIGEVLALLLILLACLLVQTDDSRKWYLAALALGFASLTKILSLIVLPIFIIFLLAKDRHRPILYRIRSTVIFNTAFTLPLILFELYRLASFKFNIALYKQSVHEYILFFKTAGSGIEPRSPTILNILVNKLHEIWLQTVFPLNHIALVVFILVTFFVIAQLLRALSSIRLPRKLMGPYINRAYLMPLCIAITWLGWWLLATDRTLVRHGFIGLVFLVLSLILAIQRPTKSRRIVALDGLVYVASVLLLLSCIINLPLQFGTAQQQSKDMYKLSLFYKNHRLHHFGWWQNPEVQYLLNTTSYSADQPTRPDDETFVLLNALEKQLVPGQYMADSKRCINKQFISERYILCELPPTTKR